jgi:CarboxypepD_reg-like domain/TonB-dependent Receptor Plug Domain
MKIRSVLSFLFLLLINTAAHVAMAQPATISGRVMDAATLEALPFANVFINKTTTGTTSDINGNFSLRNLPPGTLELVVSFVGYNSYKSAVILLEGGTLNLNIRLAAADLQLNEVEVVTKRDEEWEKNLRKFTNIFLGSTEFARFCKLVNPWVLDFKSESGGGNFFYATASQPLEIENLALGYRVVYYLTHFISSNMAYNIQGHFRFEEIFPANEKQATKWEQNRSSAYLGSPRHLFKSIVDGTVKEQGFDLYYHTGSISHLSSSAQANTFSSMLGKEIKQIDAGSLQKKQNADGSFQIELHPTIEVHYTKSYSNRRMYKDISVPVSRLEIIGGIIQASKNGVVLNPSSLIVSGAMYDMRVANMLPENYNQGDKVRTGQEVPTYTVDRMISLQEKVYIQTNKAYYYPGEEILFKGYLNYRSPELMDSLSRVLYVELIGKDSGLVDTHVLKIENGMAHGSFKLSRQLASGGYFIRSYTQWMTNYKEENVFVKQLHVLDYSDRPVPFRDPWLTDTTQISIAANKQKFAKRERIDLQLAIKSDDPQWKLASLSVSVTDMQQVINIPETSNIKTGFEFSTVKPEVKLPFQYPIEFGISLAGQHVDKKGMPRKASLLILSEDFKESRIIDTQNDGTFWASGFDFTDSTEIIFRYTDKKVKRVGSISLQSRAFPPIQRLPRHETIALEKYVGQNPKPVRDTSEKVRMLKEVTIKASRMERSKEALAVAKVYGKAEITVPGSDLVKSDANSLLDALRARVPGFNVSQGMTGRIVRIGPKSSFMSSSKTEPLLIIDGLQTTSSDFLTVGDKLAQISTIQVDRVEVIRFAAASIYGTRGGNGVIIVYTKGGEFSFDQEGMDKQNSKTLIQTIKVKGYSPAEPILFPDYGNSESGSKSGYDFRSTVYWNPLIETDETGSAKFYFYAADLATQYKIVIEGITSTGIPMRATAYVTVSE